jgi:hypothetical protein
MKATIYIRRQGFEFYLDNALPPVLFGFDPTVLSNLEVLNPTLLREQLTTFFQSQAGAGKNLLLTIILSEEVLFHKVIESQEPEVLKSEKEKFHNYIPLDEERIVETSLVINTATHIFAVNRDLYTSIMEVVKQLKGELKLVFPFFVVSSGTPDASVFNQSPGLNETYFQSIAQLHRTFPQANLLINDKEYLLAEKEKGEVKTPKQKITVVLLVLLILISLGVSIFVIAMAFMPQKKKPLSVLFPPTVLVVS